MEEEKIIKALKQGNSDVISNLMSIYQVYVYNILIAMLSKTEAQEATQDTFIKVYKFIDGFKEGSKFSTWLYKIAYRTGLDYLRKRKKTISIDDDFLKSKYIREEEKITSGIAQNEKRTQVQILLDQLEPEDAVLLKLYYLEEKKIKELVEICGLSASNIKVRLFRIRKELRKNKKQLQLV